MVVHAFHVRPLEGRRLLFIEIANPNRGHVAFCDAFKTWYCARKA